MSQIEPRAGEPARPAAPGARARWRGAAVVVLVSVLAIVLGLGAMAGALVLQADRSLQRVDVDGLRGSTPPDREVADKGLPSAADAPEEYEQGEEQRRRTGDSVAPGVRPLGEPLTILLVGMDSREGLSDEQLQELGTEDHGGELTDSLMLLRLEPDGEATVLSLPRDLLVKRCDGSRGKINGAYHVGERDGQGPTCVVQTITDLTGLEIDHYVQVNLAGFIKLVDVLGGVHLHLDESLHDPAAGLDLPAGCVELDGTGALAFVRARQVVDDRGDFGRIERQQRLLREVVAETTDADTLVNVPELFALASTAGQAIEIDHGMSLRLVHELALTFRDVEPEDVGMYTVPTVEDTSGSGYYLVPTDAAPEVFERFADGTLDRMPLETWSPGEGAEDMDAAGVASGPAPAAADHQAERQRAAADDRGAGGPDERAGGADETGRPDQQVVPAEHAAC